MSSPYTLLTCTRWDPGLLEKQRWNSNGEQASPYLLLHLHVSRLQNDALAHEWPDAHAAVSYDALHAVCEQAVASCPSDALKIRITLSRAGDLAATATPIPPLKFDPTSPSFSKPLTDSATLYGPAMTVFLDTEPTPPSPLFTSTKTTERTLYSAARARAGLPALSADSDSDVILYNPAGEITESSVSNVALYLASQWVTPPLSSGCLPGVLRRWLLRHKRIREGDPGELTKDALRPGDWVLLFNSVQGCRLARVTAL